MIGIETPPSLYGDEINKIYGKYHELIERNVSVNGNELSEKIREKFPQNIDDIEFCENHIAWIHKTWYCYYYAAKI